MCFNFTCADFPETTAALTRDLITALNRNLSHITDTVTVGGTLQWFANCLVERKFIPQRTSQNILDTHGKSPAEQAGQLMDGVLTKMRGSGTESTKCYNTFVEIFSCDEAYKELAERLRAAGKLYIISMNTTCKNPEEQYLHSSLNIVNSKNHKHLCLCKQADDAVYLVFAQTMTFCSAKMTWICRHA